MLNSIENEKKKKSKRIKLGFGNESGKALAWWAMLLTFLNCKYVIPMIVLAYPCIIKENQRYKRKQIL